MMSSDGNRAASHWDGMTDALSKGRSGYYWWEAGDEIQRQINLRISGNADEDWIAYSLSRFFSDKTPLNRCLSLGCGSGWLERRLAGRNAFVDCDGFDISSGSIEEAQKIAADMGYSNIHYSVVDINRIELPANAYGAVFIHGAMHHFEALEHVTEQIAKALKPGGILFLNEYIGPNRFQFSDRQKELGDLCLNLIPVSFRRLISPPSSDPVNTGQGSVIKRKLLQKAFEKIRRGELISTLRRKFLQNKMARSGDPQIKTRIDFPSYQGVIALDPSEAVRSVDILPVLSTAFETLEIKYYGGNIFQYLLEGIAGNFANDRADAKALIQMLFQVEDAMIQCKEFSSDYAYIAARPIRP